MGVLSPDRQPGRSTAIVDGTQGLARASWKGVELMTALRLAEIVPSEPVKAKQTGPITKEGKKKSSKNAEVHGILANVVPHRLGISRNV
jgi:hypothetical protein